MTQAHNRLDTLCTQLENLGTSDTSSTLSTAIQQTIHSAVTDAHRSSSAAAADLLDRVSRIEAASATLSKAAAAAAAATVAPAGAAGAAVRPQSAAVDGHAGGDTGCAMPQSRKVAIQRLLEVAIGDLEGRLVERVLERCAAADDAVKRHAHLH